MCYTSPRLNRKQQVPAAGASSPAGRVKGKRVRVPRDLVTVIRESAAWRSAPVTGGFASGKAAAGGELSVRKPARCWYRSVRLRITRNWSYQKARTFKGSFCCAFRAVKRLFFRLSWPPFRTLSIGNVHSTQQKGLKQCVRQPTRTGSASPPLRRTGPVCRCPHRLRCIFFHCRRQHRRKLCRRQRSEQRGG